MRNHPLQGKFLGFSLHYSEPYPAQKKQKFFHKKYNSPKINPVLFPEKAVFYSIITIFSFANPILHSAKAILRPVKPIPF